MTDFDLIAEAYRAEWKASGDHFAAYAAACDAYVQAHPELRKLDITGTVSTSVESSSRNFLEGADMRELSQSLTP